MWAKINQSFLTLLLLRNFITAIKILIQYPSEKCKIQEVPYLPYSDKKTNMEWQCLVLGFTLSQEIA